MQLQLIEGGDHKLNNELLDSTRSAPDGLLKEMVLAVARSARVPGVGADDS